MQDKMIMEREKSRHAKKEKKPPNKTENMKMPWPKESYGKMHSPASLLDTTVS